MRKLLPHLETGTQYATAVKTVYGRQRAERQAVDLLPPVLEAEPQLRNPAVCRALSELRKVVNALVRRYGKPRLVRIELARDLKRSRSVRQRRADEIKDNENTRKDAKKRIVLEMGERYASATSILKLRLADECNWTCPYTGRGISMQALLGDNPQFDIEHILPFRRTLDNSYINKTLCFSEENRNRKHNQSPFEAYSGDVARWQEMLDRVGSFRGRARRPKIDRFRLEEMPEDFANRQLNDTAYISSLAAEYLALLYGGRVDEEKTLRVQVSAGRVTKYLREEWGLDSILGREDEKNRQDHRHHAVDAIAIAMASPIAMRLLSRASQRADALGRRLFVPLDPPWPEFLNDAREAVQAINVSSRVRRKLGGQLHDANPLSKPIEVAGKHGAAAKVHHLRKQLWKLSPGEVSAIVDDRVRAAVKEKLAALGGLPERAFADPKDHPYLVARNGRIVPIHKARIRKRAATKQIGSGDSARFVTTGANHHIEIVAVVDKEGRDRKWEGHLVSTLDAVLRRSGGSENNGDVIRRDHGPGRQFRFSLAKGEYVQMRDKQGEFALFRTVRISKNEIEFRLHSDARPTKILEKTRGARTRCGPNKLRDLEARKVVVDPLGEIHGAND